MKEIKSERNKERKKETRELLRQKKEKGCIDLHHVISCQKEVNPACLVSKGWSVIKIKKELEKCVPLCANCHRKLHANIIEWVQFLAGVPRK